ncbi:MAG: complex I subunit 5 family protein [bacterium]
MRNRSKIGLIIFLAALFSLVNFYSFPGEGWLARAETEAHEAGHHEVVHHEAGHHKTEGHQEKQHGHEGIAPYIERGTAFSASLPLLVILAPLFAAFLVAFYGKDSKNRDIITIAGTGIPFFFLLLMIGPVISGTDIGHTLHKGILAAYSFLPGFDFTFKVDPANLLIALVTSFLWLATTIYSTEYMSVEGKEQRFAFFNLLTLMADLGVLLAGDFMTLFFFFEGLVIFPYSLLIHRETEEARRGADNYLYLGVVSGLALLLGIVLLYAQTGSVAITALTQARGAHLTSRGLIAFLMIVGFGVKAGLFGLHIWMTTGYPNSPNSACALSSGGMIKAGAYGIFRVVNLLFIPVGGWAALKSTGNWVSLHHIGYIVIWVGTITMFMGVLGALISENSNKMLGFHSVSQMGYIVMGIGCAAYMGADGAMGVAGALYHILNHALFKAVLFLGVGAVYFRTKEINMYKLGGLFDNMPVVAICTFIAVMGISGIPGFNGFASKTVLHHAIVEAQHFSASYAKAGDDAFSLKLVEIIFMLTAGGTFASNIKMFLLIFKGKRPEKYDNVEDAPLMMRVGLISLSAAIVFIGIFPNFILEHFIGPSLAYMNFSAGSHAYHQLFNLHAASDASHSIIPLLYPVGEGIHHAWSVVIENLMGAGIAVSLGGMYFILGMKYGWFHIHIGKGGEFETYYKMILRGFKWICKNPATSFGIKLNYYMTVLGRKAYAGFVWFCLNPSFVFGDFIDLVMTKLMEDFWQSLSDKKSLIYMFEDKFIPQWVYDKELWQNWIAKKYLEFCEIYRIFDPKVIDRTVNEVADNTLVVGERSRVLQSDKLELYILLIGLSVVSFIGLSFFLFY